MISVVVPIYNEQETIVALHCAMQEAMNGSGEEWEAVYVNDGSKDMSLPLLIDQQTHDSHVVVVNLSRNWGHQGAISAGLAVAKGDAIVTMDGDLQDHPSVIPSMIEAWKNGAQIVLAERRSRQDRGIKAFLYPIFYNVLGRISDYPIPLNSGIFGLVDRKVVDQLNSMPERNRYIPGLKTFVGFRTATVFYDRLARHAGEPKYTWKKLIKYAFDAIYSFSYKPLRLALVSGGALLTSTLIVGLLLLGASASAAIRSQVWFEYSAALTGLLFVAGLQLTCMGFMGEYIGRIYDEVRHRPLFVIDQVQRADSRVPISIHELQQVPVTAEVIQHGKVTPVEVPGIGQPVVIPLPSAA